MLVGRPGSLSPPPTAVDIPCIQNEREKMFGIALKRPRNLSHHFGDMANHYNWPGRNFEHYFRRPGVAINHSYAIARRHC